MMVLGRIPRGSRTEVKRMLALYWMRAGRRKPHPRSIIQRYRRVTYPRARRSGMHLPLQPSRWPQQLRVLA